MNLRRGRRAVALAGALLFCMVRLAFTRLRGPLSPVRRAQWLQSACRGVLSSLGVTVRVTGAVPSRGLVVSNHLSYLDIAIYSAAMPCVFVSKAEIRSWPYFGFAARVGGTIFLDRATRTSSAQAASEMSQRLLLPVPVLLFPEGTSTDGSQVLRFHSTLFQPAVEAGAAVIPAAVRYVPEAGAQERDLCWFGDAGFLDHLWRALGGPGFSAEITLGEPVAYPDRRRAALATHELVEQMREAGPNPVWTALAQIADF